MQRGEEGNAKRGLASRTPVARAQVCLFVCLLFDDGKKIYIYILRNHGGGLYRKGILRFLLTGGGYEKLLFFLKMKSGENAVEGGWKECELNGSTHGPLIYHTLNYSGDGEEGSVNGV